MGSPFGFGGNLRRRPWFDFESYQHQQPEAAVPDQENPGFMVRQDYNGQPVSSDLGIQARNRGLVGLGTALLAGASSKDYGDTFARALAGFNSGQEDVLSHGLDQQRQARLDKAQEQQRSLDNARQALYSKGEEQRQAGVSRGEAERSEIRSATARSAPEMAALVEKFFGPESTEAKEARIAASFGASADMDRLQHLADLAEARSHLGEDAARKRQQEIDDAKAEDAAGFGPLAASRRDQRRLGYEGERVALERQGMNLRQLSSAGGGGYSAQQDRLDDNVRAEAKMTLKAREDDYKDRLKAWQADNSMALGRPKSERPTFDREAELAAAEKEVRERYGQQAGASTAPAKGSAPSATGLSRDEVLDHLRLKGITGPAAAAIADDTLRLEAAKSPKPKPVAAPSRDSVVAARTQALAGAVARQRGTSEAAESAKIRARIARGEDPNTIYSELSALLRSP